MKKNPLVSIVMCCYNGSKYIDRSFRSILDQTYPRIELVFVNDGSTDDSSMHAESYRSAFEKRGYSLQIINQDNQGSGRAAINGLKQAMGHYLTYFDVDDFLMSESISLRVEFLESHPQMDVVRTNGYEVSEGNLSERTVPLVRNAAEKEDKEIFYDLLMGFTNNWAGSYMVRMEELKRFYQNKSIPVSRYGQNLQVLMPLTKGKKAGFIDVPLMKYIRNEQSYTLRNNTLEKELDLLRGYWDIRWTMLELMDVTDQQLLLDCKIRYLNLALNICSSYQHASMYNHYYQKLKSISILDWRIKMEHALINHSPLALFYRIAAKMETISKH